MVAFLLPITSWLLSLISFIVDEVLTMHDAFEGSGVAENHIDANLVNQKSKQMLEHRNEQQLLTLHSQRVTVASTVITL